MVKIETLRIASVAVVALVSFIGGGLLERQTQPPARWVQGDKNDVFFQMIIGPASDDAPCLISGHAITGCDLTGNAKAGIAAWLPLRIRQPEFDFH